MTYCKICGEYECKKHNFLIPKSIKITEFSGSSPPEIFVGHYNYPKVNLGILSPQIYGNTKILSSPEQWYKYNLNKEQIVNLRAQLIYGKTQEHVKSFKNRFLKTIQETAMTHKSVSTEFKLKKPIIKNKEHELKTPLILNSAQVENIRLQENPKIKQKIEYITSDTDAKSIIGMLELEKAEIDSEHIIKILSAGLLGIKTKRKLVPTRWSIVTVDSALSEDKIKKIKYFPEINEFQVFNEEYLGNHYEILLIPRYWSFEVIEISLNKDLVWKDYETIFKRKNYASSVTGAYYSNRLGITEYLVKIKKQASCLVLREIRPEYNIPLGVGILRETTRAAMKKTPNKFNTLKEAISNMQLRLKQPITNFLKNSELLKELQQRRLYYSQRL